MSDMMDVSLQMLWRQSWQLVLMVLIVWPIAQLSQRRYPRFAYVLWLMVMIKSLVPFQFTLPTATLLNLNTLPAINITELIVGVEGAVNFSFETIFAMLWVAIVIFLMLKLVLNEFRFLKTLEAAEELELPGLDGLLEKFKINRTVRILRSSEVSVPQTLGIRNPVVIIPEAQFSRASEDLLPVVAHELAHIQRRDMIAISTQAVFTILFFFHPLVHFVNRWMDLNRERICDEMAMEALELKPKSYGRELLTHLEASLRPHPEIIVSGGMFMTKKNVLKRFEYLMDGREKIMLKIKHGQKLIIGLLLLGMVILSCSDESALPDLGATGSTADPLLNKTSAPAVDEDVFVEYDTPPEPIGGYQEIMKAVVYPEPAREAGIEGTVIVQVLINKDGSTGMTKVLKGAEDASLNEAAQAALKDVKWKPAIANEKAVAVKVALPIVFKLEAK